jgi:hypothetical protein
LTRVIPLSQTKEAMGAVLSGLVANAGSADSNRRLYHLWQKVADPSEYVVRQREYATQLMVAMQ